MSAPQIAIAAVLHILSLPDPTSKDIAVAMVSVFYAGESQLQPGSHGVQGTETPGALNPRGSFGIASWNGARQAALQAFAAYKNLPVDAVNTQLEFCLTECANSYPGVWAAIQAKKMPCSDFIRLFVQVYENPKDPHAEIARSIAFANDLYPAIPNLPAPAPVPVAVEPKMFDVTITLTAIVDPVTATVIGVSAKQK